MKKLSYREYKLRLAWLEDQWNNPSRTDYYLMRLTAIVGGLFSKKKVKLEDQKISFDNSTSRATKPKITKEQASAKSKSRWFGFLGLQKKNTEESKIPIKD